MSGNFTFFCGSVWLTSSALSESPFVAVAWMFCLTVSCVHLQSSFSWLCLPTYGCTPHALYPGSMAMSAHLVLCTSPVMWLLVTMTAHTPLCTCPALWLPVSLSADTYPAQLSCYWGSLLFISHMWSLTPPLALSLQCFPTQTSLSSVGSAIPVCHTAPHNVCRNILFSLYCHYIHCLYTNRPLVTKT